MADVNALIETLRNIGAAYHEADANTPDGWSDMTTAIQTIDVVTDSIIDNEADVRLLISGLTMELAYAEHRLRKVKTAHKAMIIDMHHTDAS